MKEIKTGKFTLEYHYKTFPVSFTPNEKATYYQIEIKTKEPKRTYITNNKCKYIVTDKSEIQVQVENHPFFSEMSL